MEHCLPQGLNILDQIDLEVRSPCTLTHPEPVDGVVVGDGGSEAAIDNHRHCLPHHLHGAYAAVVTSPFKDQDHHMPGRILHEFSFQEFCLDQLHHHLLFSLSPTLLHSLSPVLGSSIPPP